MTKARLLYLVKQVYYGENNLHSIKRTTLTKPFIHTWQKFEIPHLRKSSELCKTMI